MSDPRSASKSDSEQAAYAAALRLISRRELSEAQMRERLGKRGFSAGPIAAVIGRLRRERILDDRRVAMACARRESTIRRHGAHRVLRQLHAIGIDRDLARETVREVFSEVDESALLERAIGRRLRGRPLKDASETRRLYAYLVRQGFPPGAISRALRAKGGAVLDRDDSA